MPSRPFRDPSRSFEILRGPFEILRDPSRSFEALSRSVRNANRSHWTLWREAHWPSVRAESPFLVRLGSGLYRWITHLCCPPTPVARHYLIRKHHRSGMSSRQRSASVHTTCTRVRKRFEKCSKRVRKGTCTHAACPPSCQPAPAPTRTCAHARPRACPPAHLPTRLPTYPPAEDESMKMKGKGSMNLAYTQLPLLFILSLLGTPVQHRLYKRTSG